ncbi:MAG: phosphoglycerate mutase family protein [Ilumatobacteraceae bacterium]
MLYLVRHAKAGSRRGFEGNDRLRPLSPAGRRQATALAERLTAAGVTTLISSPYLRCIETLQPTAQAIDGAVESDERLAEGHRFVGVLELLADLPDGSAVCSHGDVIPETIAALERRGCEFTSEPEWRKASVWLLDRDARGEIVSAGAWPPPDV